MCTVMLVRPADDNRVCIYEYQSCLLSVTFRQDSEVQTQQVQAQGWWQTRHELNSDFMVVIGCGK